MTPIGRRVGWGALALTAALVVPSGATAQIAKVDPRALALGGGYVAVADGWAALQWNPAGLWVSGRNEFAVVYGNVALESGPWIDSLRAVAGVASPISPGAAVATLSSRDAGLAGERALGIYLASIRFGGAVQQVTYVSEIARVGFGDVFVDQASLRTREFQISFAHPLADGRVAVGLSAKAVQALGTRQRLPLTAFGTADLAAAELLAAARRGPEVAEQTVFAVDAGVLVMATARLRLGAVVKNLNAPALDAGSQITMRLPRQVRVGGLLLPHPAVKLTLDFDLSTESFIDGLRQRRELGGGLELDAGKLAARAGMLFDLAGIERRPLYTFGLGVGDDGLRFDVAGSWAPERDGLGWIGALAAEF